MLIITGYHGKGPLIGNLDKYGRILVAHEKRRVTVGTETQTIWFTQDGRQVNLTSAQVGGRSERLFDALGLFSLCDHTWRVSFCIWAAQSGGDLLSIIATGFWNADMSAEWHKYFAKGLQRQHKHTNMGTVDPLLRVFPYPELGMLVQDYDLDPDDMVKPVF